MDRILEQKVRMAIESSMEAHGYYDSMPMWIMDAQTTRFIKVNRAASVQYGYTRDEFMNMSLSDISCEGELPGLPAVLEGEELEYFDAGFTTHRKKDGSTFSVHLFTHATEYEGRDVQFCYAASATDRLPPDRRCRELVELIKMQKQELDEILVSINDAIWSRTADTHRLIYGNKAYYDLYGVAPEDMDPEFDYIINSVYPPDRELMAAGIMAMKKTGKAEVVYRHHHVDGSMRTIRVQATLKKGSDGRPDVVTGISTDITQEKALFDAMRNTEQKLLATINNTRDLIWSVDRDLKLTFCNTAYQDFFRKRSGVALDEGDYVLGSWHSGSFIARRKKDYERALDGECFTVVVAENFNGTVQYNEISSTPIFNQEGWVVGVNCIARDITHQRRQLINVRMQNEKLKSVARKKMQTLKDQVTAGHQPNGAGLCMDAALAAIESITAELIAISNNLDVTHPDTEDIISRT